MSANTYGSEQPRLLYPKGDYTDWCRLKAATYGGINPTATLTGNVADGNTVTIGDDTYEFDDDASVIAGNIAVDISNAAGGATPAAAGKALAQAISLQRFVADGGGAGHNGAGIVVLCVPVGTTVSKSGANITLAATTETWTTLVDGQTLNVKKTKLNGDAAIFQATSSDFALRTTKRITLEGDTGRTELRQLPLRPWIEMTYSTGSGGKHSHIWGQSSNSSPMTIRNLKLMNADMVAVVDADGYIDYASPGLDKGGIYHIENCYMEGSAYGIWIIQDIHTAYPNWSEATPYNFTSPNESWIKDCEINCPGWQTVVIGGCEYEVSHNTFRNGNYSTPISIVDDVIKFSDYLDDGVMQASLLRIGGAGGTFVLKADGQVVSSSTYTLLTYTYSLPTTYVTGVRLDSGFDPAKRYTISYETMEPWGFDQWGVGFWAGNWYGAAAGIVREVNIHDNIFSGLNADNSPCQLRKLSWAGPEAFYTGLAWGAIDIEIGGDGVLENVSVIHNTLDHMGGLSGLIAFSGISASFAPMQNCMIAENTFDHCWGCLGVIQADGIWNLYSDFGIPVNAQNITWTGDIVTDYQYQGLAPGVGNGGAYVFMGPMTQCNITSVDFRTSGMLPATDVSLPVVPLAQKTAIWMDYRTMNNRVFELGKMPAGYNPGNFMLDDGQQNKFIPGSVLPRAGKRAKAAQRPVCKFGRTKKFTEMVG